MQLLSSCRRARGMGSLVGVPLLPSGRWLGCSSPVPHTAVGQRLEAVCGPQPPAHLRAHSDFRMVTSAGGTVILAKPHGTQGLALHTHLTGLVLPRASLRSKPSPCPGESSPCLASTCHPIEGGVPAGPSPLGTCRKASPTGAREASGAGGWDTGAAQCGCGVSPGPPPFRRLCVTGNKTFLLCEKA